MPAVCVSRSRIVIGRLAATTATGLPGDASAGGGTTTLVALNAGMNLWSGSLSRMRPSSTSIMMATLVIAFDCDAMRNMESFCIGTLRSMSARPAAS